MRLPDIFTLAVDGVKERKFRFALNLVGIIIGCAAITGLISITQGLGDEISEQLEMFGPNNIMVMPGQLQPGRGIVGYTFTWRDLEIIRRIPHIEIATPIVGNKVCQVNVRGNEYNAYIYGIYPEYFTVFTNFELSEGRTISKGDGAVAVIGAQVAHPQYEDEPIIYIGDRVKLQARVRGESKEMMFRVVGIMKGVGGSFGSEDDNSITIPLRVFQQFYDVGGEIDYIAATVDNIGKLDEVVENIENRMGDSATVMTQEAIQETVGEVLGSIEAVLGGIAAISLVVAGVGIINTMTVSVMERTREIGIMKAVGAKSMDVLMMFLSEALITGFIGGTIGALLGFGLGQIVGGYINMPVSLSPFLGGGVTAFAMLTSAISGLYPAWRAANLRPVEALRYE